MDKRPIEWEMLGTVYLKDLLCIADKSQKWKRTTTVNNDIINKCTITYPSETKLLLSKSFPKVKCLYRCTHASVEKYEYHPKMKHFNFIASLGTRKLHMKRERGHFHIHIIIVPSVVKFHPHTSSSKTNVSMVLSNTKAGTKEWLWLRRNDKQVAKEGLPLS